MAFNPKYWKEYNFFLKQLSVREPLRVGLFTLNLSDKFTISQEAAYKLITDLYTYNEKLFTLKDNIVSATGYTKRFIKYGGFFWVYCWAIIKNISFLLSMGISLFAIFYTKQNENKNVYKVSEIDSTLYKHTRLLEKLQEQLTRDSLL